MSNVGAFSLGGQVYVAGLPWARQQVELFFDPQDCHNEVQQPSTIRLVDLGDDSA